MTAPKAYDLPFPTPRRPPVIHRGGALAGLKGSAAPPWITRGRGLRLLLRTQQTTPNLPNHSRTYMQKSLIATVTFYMKQRSNLFGNLYF
jgi:hypothetical protein